MSDLGKLLRNLRGKESLRDVSRRSGISHTYLSIIEKGIDQRSGNPVKPTPDTLKILAKAYNYPYEELMRLAGYLPEDTANLNRIGEMPSEYKVELENILQRADVVFRGKGLNAAERKRVLDMLTLLFQETVQEHEKKTE